MSKRQANIESHPEE